MLFNSFIYLFAFLPASFVGFFLIRRLSLPAAKAYLVVASLFFYSWWQFSYLPILVGSMLFNYGCGCLVGASGKHWTPALRKGVLVFGVAANLLLLGYFKYTNFLLDNVSLALGTHWSMEAIVLPLGISFFTFQQISYLVDSYRGLTKEYQFINYAVFVTFFPQLVAGPIVHHGEMMPQFHSHMVGTVNTRNVAMGLFLLSLGLFQKTVLADSLAPLVNNGFALASQLTLFEAWFTALGYTLQIYFDFSGYTDMALGAALLFNIRLPYNFNRPYAAVSIQDFWRRWHMTLSRFLLDYLYIPLGGNRKGTARTLANLFTVFLLGGIWHGAGWGFVIWGALHGTAAVVHRVWMGFGRPMHVGFARVLTFLFVAVAWVFFRSTSLAQAMDVLRGMVGTNGVVLPSLLESKLPFLTRFGIDFGGFVENIQGGYYTPLVVIGLLVLSVKARNSVEYLADFPWRRRSAVLGAAMLVAGCIFMNNVSEFLYFNF